jgi:hypothetical protein
MRELERLNFKPEDYLGVKAMATVEAGSFPLDIVGRAAA